MRAMHINRSMMSCFFVAPVRQIRKSFATFSNLTVSLSIAVTLVIQFYRMIAPLRAKEVTISN